MKTKKQESVRPYRKPPVPFTRQARCTSNVGNNTDGTPFNESPSQVQFAHLQPRSKNVPPPSPSSVALETITERPRPVRSNVFRRSAPATKKRIPETINNAALIDYGAPNDRVMETRGPLIIFAFQPGYRHPLPRCLFTVNPVNDFDRPLGPRTKNRISSVYSARAP